MPLFMDCHNVSGEMPPDEALAAAHAADLRLQGQYGVRFHNYWVSREAGKIYCLVDAPDAETAPSSGRFRAKRPETGERYGDERTDRARLPASSAARHAWQRQ